MPALRQAILLFHPSLLLNSMFPNADRCLLLLNYLYIIKEGVIRKYVNFFLFFQWPGEKDKKQEMHFVQSGGGFFGLGLQTASVFLSDLADLHILQIK